MYLLQSMGCAWAPALFLWQKPNEVSALLTCYDLVCLSLRELPLYSLVLPIYRKPIPPVCPFILHSWTDSHTQDFKTITSFNDVRGNNKRDIEHFPKQNGALSTVHTQSHNWVWCSPLPHIQVWLCHVCAEGWLCPVDNWQSIDSPQC